MNMESADNIVFAEFRKTRRTLTHPKQDFARRVEVRDDGRRIVYIGEKSWEIERTFPTIRKYSGMPPALLVILRPEHIENGMLQMVRRKAFVPAFFATQDEPVTPQTVIR